MFAIFNNNTLVGFWGNKPGDIFFNITCEKLGLNSPEIFYYDIQEAPLYHSFNQNKVLSILEKVVTIVNEEEVIAYNTISTKQPDPYFTNGIFYKDC